jgi:hypothetical protein
MNIDPKKIARMITEDPNEVVPSDHFDDFEDEYMPDVFTQTRPVAEILATRMNGDGIKPGKEQDHPAYYVIPISSGGDSPHMSSNRIGNPDPESDISVSLSQLSNGQWVVWDEWGANGTTIAWDGEEWTAGPDIES